MNYFTKFTVQNGRQSKDHYFYTVVEINTFMFLVPNHWNKFLTDVLFVTMFVMSKDAEWLHLSSKLSIILCLDSKLRILIHFKVWKTSTYATIDEEKLGWEAVQWQTVTVWDSFYFIFYYSCNIRRCLRCRVS